MPGTPGPSTGQNGTPTTPKAIANLAKRPSEDVTRRGMSKMKFTPVLPVRRKKEEPKPEAKAEAPAPSQDARGRGRGHSGTPRGRGRGDARGAAPREMVATGPLALGPTMTGSSASRRSAAPRSNFAPVTPRTSAVGTGASSSCTVPSSSSSAGVATRNAPSLKREPFSSDAGQKLVEIEAETYSDPDEGVEIVDMDDVRRMDWMAPESLRKEKVREKKKKRRATAIKREPSRDKGKVKAEPQDVMVEEEEAEEDQIDHANALDLSESEEEEELEDIFNDFAAQEEDRNMDVNVRQEKLYFFQFPEPFPIFAPPHPRSQSTQAQAKLQSQNVIMEDAATPKSTGTGKVPESPGKGKKVVSFAPDVKPPASGGSTPTPSGSDTKKEESTTPTVPLDGVIGRLEIHQSGAVKMRLENGILLDVTAATQPSFLQHAVHVDVEKEMLRVLGEVNRRFVVSPNIDALLEAFEVTDGDVVMEVDPAEL